MTQSEKESILIFSNNAFKQFYADNYVFLTDEKYKPGKKTYRNLLSLNKFMKCYLQVGKDYISKQEVIALTGWSGPSSYVQHERIITNFGLSDTPWQARKRDVLLLSEAGKKIRDQYAEYCKLHPQIDLAELDVLPDFAIRYLIAQIKNTTSQNMTLWKNTIISALFMYCNLGYIPSYSKNTSNISLQERRAFKECLNYVKNGALQDVDYTKQPIAMLKNLKLLDANGKLTHAGYTLLKDMKLFSETDSAYNDFVACFEENICAVTEILTDSISMTKVSTPERKIHKSVVKTSSFTKRPINRNFSKEAEVSHRIGRLGEQLALAYERKRLKELGVENVEDNVFLTSDHPNYGNAYPCDLISIDPASGTIIYIEVKATKKGIDAPFYISKEELAFSEENRENYRLYRIYNVMEDNVTPEFYETTGYIGDNFALIADRYIATRDVIVDDE